MEEEFYPGQPTDYWVSQERKFCEFCKCSISANKASIEFHENGKNHKENVAKRLLEIQKKAAKEAKEAVNMDNEMKRIEAAALRAYAKDMKTNPDYTSHTIGELVLPDLPEEKKKSSGGKNKSNKHQRFDRPRKKWMEAISDEGHTYYWNVETGESVWDPPEEGFESLLDQKRLKEAKPSGGKPTKFKKKFSHKHGKGGSGALGDRKEGGGDDNEDDEGQLKKKKKNIDDKVPILEVFSVPQGEPYGKWEKVETKVEEPVDLQLPEQPVMMKMVVPSIREESERKFKEKKIPTPGSIASVGGEIGFKKRKFSTDPKRNMRQRLDDD